ncbi:MAG: CsbD family protein [Acidobacteriia bacterium]|nr:CsbD family protein [Terriglobia bacterium]
MNSDVFEGKWKQLKGQVKQRWGKLTDDDLTHLSGKKDELVGKLQERYGYTREQAVREADEFAKTVNSDLDATTVGAHSGVGASKATSTGKH